MPTPKLSPTRRFSRILILTLTFAAVTLSLSSISRAQTETVLYTFPGGDDGAVPDAGLLLGTAGNLYGTTGLGGSANFGTAFELSPASGGAWTATYLHVFGENETDGIGPGGPLIADRVGNLYGTAGRGGVANGGIIFELSRTKKGEWHEAILYSFPVYSAPSAGLVFDATGNLYGTGAAAQGEGSAFELSPLSGGGWGETVLYTFTGGMDGGFPFGFPMVFDSLGNLYGTAEIGGLSHGCPSYGEVGCGVVFELSPAAGGGWNETVLYTFTGGSDGGIPKSGVIIDSSGNLYGSATIGGNVTECKNSGGCGVIFKLTRAADGKWRETLIHQFTGGTDGSIPASPLILDSLGNIYGTTQYGGETTTHGCGPNGCGLVFKFSPVSGGWRETVLHAFGPPPDGAYTASGVILDQSGNLYGTTPAGGADGLGIVFEIVP
jgi:uncharacterized repeat protein (TIGR03803 family)